MVAAKGSKEENEECDDGRVRGGDVGSGGKKTGEW